MSAKNPYIVEYTWFSKPRKNTFATLEEADKFLDIVEVKFGYALRNYNFKNKQLGNWYYNKNKGD